MPKKHYPRNIAPLMQSGILATHERNNIGIKSFRYEKRQLRMHYKLLKAGMIKPEEVPTKFRKLLTRYYNVPEKLWA